MLIHLKAHNQKMSVSDLPTRCLDHSFRRKKADRRITITAVI